MSKANEVQVAGDHYKSPYQHWDWVQEVNLTYLPANVTKYLSRWRKKNGIQDLEKARHYLEKFIEEETEKRAKVLAATGRFTMENVVQGDERQIMWLLVDHAAPNTSALQQALSVLTELINHEKIVAHANK